MRAAARTAVAAVNRTVRVGSILGRAGANDQRNPSSVNPMTWNLVKGD
jgi:hypothetical protein